MNRMRAATARRSWVALSLALLAAACGGSSSVSCPNDAVACPATAPSYASSVSAIIQNHCIVCHSPGGQQSSRPFTTYPEVFSYRSSILNMVYACRMPPAGQPQLAAAERTQLVDWLACGAPNN
jgi:hypothetical protein